MMVYKVIYRLDDFDIGVSTSMSAPLLPRIGDKVLFHVPGRPNYLTIVENILHEIGENNHTVVVHVKR